MHDFGTCVGEDIIRIAFNNTPREQPKPLARKKRQATTGTMHSDFLKCQNMSFSSKPPMLNYIIDERYLYVIIKFRSFSLISVCD